jgi:hypothetical protein
VASDTPDDIAALNLASFTARPAEPLRVPSATTAMPPSARTFRKMSGDVIESSALSIMDLSTVSTAKKKCT